MDWCPIQYVFRILGQISTIKKVHLSVYLSICLSVYLSIPKIPGIGSRYTVTLISIQSFVHLFWPFVHLSSVHTIDGLLVTTISLSHTHWGKLGAMAGGGWVIDGRQVPLRLQLSHISRSDDHSSLSVHVHSAAPQPHMTQCELARLLASVYIIIIFMAFSILS